MASPKPAQEEREGVEVASRVSRVEWPAPFPIPYIYRGRGRLGMPSLVSPPLGRRKEGAERKLPPSCPPNFVGFHLILEGTARP
jgi:hypothetical protein